MDQNQMAREWIAMKFDSMDFRNELGASMMVNIRYLGEVANQHGIDLTKVEVIDGELVDFADIDLGEDVKPSFADSVLGKIHARLNFWRSMAIERLTPTQKRELDTLAAVKEVPQSSANRRTYDVLVARGLATVGPMAADFNVTGYRYVGPMTLADLMADTTVGNGVEPDTISQH